MRDPRWINFIFDVLVRMVGAGRFTRALYPLMAAFFSCTVVLLWEAGEPADDYAALLPTVSEARLVAAQLAQVGTTAATVEPAAASVPHAVGNASNLATPPVAKFEALRTLPKLSREQLTKEQLNLAQFIASRYRVAFESTQVFVDGAYTAAREYKVDPWLLLAVMAVESSFNPDAQSNRGAHGLMQVLTRVHADKFAPFGGVAAAFDPISNIRVGARILRDYISRDGSVEGGLKAYVGAALMDNDQGYGWKVLAERERMAAVAAGKPVPGMPARPPVADGKSAGTGDKADGAPASARDSILELLGNVMSGGSGGSGSAAAGHTPNSAGAASGGSVAAGQQGASAMSTVAVTDSSQPAVHGAASAAGNGQPMTSPPAAAMPAMPAIASPLVAPVIHDPRNAPDYQ